MTNTSNRQVGVLPTGSFGLDWVLGIGGLPQGKIVELYGPNVLDKEILAMAAIATAQHARCTAAYIDVAHTFNPNTMKEHGVDIERLLVSQPSSVEQALEIVDVLHRSDAVELIVVNSMKCHDFDEHHMDNAIRTRAIANALRKLSAVRVSIKNSTVVFLNHYEEHKPTKSVTFNGDTNNPGNALKFYTPIRVQMTRVREDSENGALMHKTTLKCVKNKVAPQSIWRSITLENVADDDAAVLNIAVWYGVVSTDNNQYTFDGVYLGNNFGDVKYTLGGDAKLLEAIKDGIRNRGAFYEIETDSI